MRSCAGCSGSLGAEAVRGAVKQGFVETRHDIPPLPPTSRNLESPAGAPRCSGWRTVRAASNNVTHYQQPLLALLVCFCLSFGDDRFCEQGLQLFIRGPPSLQVPGLPLPAGEAVGP